MQKDKELFDSMRNIVILNSLHFSYPLPILMRVSYNTLIVKQNTSDYYKYTKKSIGYTHTTVVKCTSKKLPEAIFTLNIHIFQKKVNFGILFVAFSANSF